jgi:spore germination cell wall hydrolase CwlJ-like protein
MLPTPTKPAPTLAIRAILIAVALVLVVAPALIVRFAPHRPPVPRVKLAERVVPKTELPTVEPVEFQALAPDDAKTFNATVPFSTLPNPAARPFFIGGSDDDRARAIDCLAVAVLYEAGDDTEGERAVAQVIVNRARHPAFPKTICGVVFQGSERSTGCQFTFTCDGALNRWKPSAAAWDRARDVAKAALSGSVDKIVGYSTHYHTDWVVPYWSSSLDKVAAVETHLFFRWTGWWGTPPAFSRTISSGEPAIAALGGISDAHRIAAAALTEITPATVSSASVADISGQPLSIDPNSFLVTLDPRMDADAFPAVALKTCGARDYCKLMAWTDKAHTPAGVPLEQAQIMTMAFSYLRDKAHGYEKSLWNCAQFKRTAKNECMKLQVLSGAVASAATPAPQGAPPAAVGTTVKPAAVTPPGVKFTMKPAAAVPPADGLSGIRRKPDAAPKPAATPTPKSGGGGTPPQAPSADPAL